MKNILLIEDDLINSKTINEKLNQFGYYITNAYDGKSGLELFKKINPPVTIIGSSIPNIGVDKLVQKIKDYNTNAIILLESSHVDDNSKNKILISNIFYLIDKPIDFEKFPEIVEKAYSEASKLNKKHYKEFEEKQKVLEEIEIQKQKNLIANRIRIAKKEQDASIFYYLKTYLSQGAGIGVLVSIIKMMLFRPLIEDNKYLIGEDIMEMLRDNLIIVDNVLNTFEELDYLTTNELSLEEVSYFELLSLLLNSKEKVDHYSNHREHSITFSDSVDQSKNHKFLVNKEFIEKVFYELLINSLKFSTEKTYISVEVKLNKDNYLEFSIINNPRKELQTNLYDNFETLIFNPFIRINNYIDEYYNSLDFGLGLTMVEKVVKSHKGKIKVTRLLESSENAEEKLMITVEIPTIR